MKEEKSFNYWLNATNLRKYNDDLWFDMETNDSYSDAQVSEMYLKSIQPQQKEEGIFMQDLFDLINEISPNPLQSQMFDVIDLVHKNYPQQKEIRKKGEIHCNMGYVGCSNIENICQYGCVCQAVNSLPLPQQKEQFSREDMVGFGRFFTDLCNSKEMYLKIKAKYPDIKLTDDLLLTEYLNSKTKPI